jgi:hypothetical protein
MPKRIVRTYSDDTGPRPGKTAAQKFEDDHNGPERMHCRLESWQQSVAVLEDEIVITLITAVYVDT